jgi:chromosome segregation ATPase
MNGIDKINLRQDLTCATVILEHWVSVLEQMKKIQGNLADLPDDLQILKQQLNDLEENQNYYTNNLHNKTNQASKINSDSALRMLPHRLKHLEMQNSINNLERELPRLVFLEEKINNLIAQKEILEALQERIQNKTTNTYDAEFQQLKNNWEYLKFQGDSLNYRSVKPQKPFQAGQINKRNQTQRRRNPFKNVRNNSTSENLGIGLTLLFGLFLSWSIFNVFTSPSQMNPVIDATTIDAEHSLELEEEF